MLESLHVKNLALIDEIEVEFKEGLNILTGETGAGKSIILGSVNLALGARCTKDMIRTGAEYGFVEISFSVRKEQQIQRLKELDIYPEDGTITLSRRLMQGRSVSRINGETVPMSLLKEVSSILIDIHGQHEHQSLLYKKNHLGITDAYAGEALREIKEQVKADFQAYRDCRKELEEAAIDESSRMKELAFLEFEVNEIRNAGLRIGEDDELETQYRRMQNGKRIRDALEETHRYTSNGNPNASDCLSRGIRSLAEAAGYDDRAGALYEQLGEIDSLLNDFNRELSLYENNCEFSEEDFYDTENRLNEINRLKTKYGSRIEEIMSYCEEKAKRIVVLEDYDKYLSKLRLRTEETEKQLKQSSAALSDLRKKFALRLENDITAGLKDLNFEKTEFQIWFDKTNGYTADGTDDIEFRISLNPGQPPKPLGEVASGGELSRIMLAIKAVMAEKDDIETLIFDEIDVGISGRTAQKVSEKMALIGAGHQVICITHLAQIAAMADHHYRIEKVTEEGNARTHIIPLGEQESVLELTRILGGAQITDIVRKNAEEMKKLAEELKSRLKV